MFCVAILRHIFLVQCCELYKNSVISNHIKFTHNSSYDLLESFSWMSHVYIKSQPSVITWFILITLVQCWEFIYKFCRLQSPFICSVKICSEAALQDIMIKAVAGTQSSLKQAWNKNMSPPSLLHFCTAAHPLFRYLGKGSQSKWVKIFN